jgi:hypothetical protein
VSGQDKQEIRRLRKALRMALATMEASDPPEGGRTAYTIEVVKDALKPRKRGES